MINRLSTRTVLCVALGLTSAVRPQSGRPGDPAEAVLRDLYNDSGWVRVDSLKTGQEIFNKSLHSSPVPAIMVTQESAIGVQVVVETIEDVGRYTDFIHDAYLERSDLLARLPDGLDAYQLLALPFMANRHYIYRMGKTMDRDAGIIRFEWFLLPRDSRYASFLDSMDVLYDRPIYPRAMAGSWEIVPVSPSKMRLTYRLYADPAGWVPYFLVARANRVIAPAMVREMVAEAARREGP